MFWAAPNPRFRLYTNVKMYCKAFILFLSGGMNRGNYVNQLEEKIRRMFSIKYAHATPQCRVGIYLAVKAVITPGQKVILSPYTIADVINMVICAGGVPVFADIDRGTTNISANEVYKLADGRTGAVLVTHLHGIACEIEKIQQICREKAIPLIEDAAQCLGGYIHRKRLGGIGDIGIFSFGMYKNLTAFYGGMIITNQKKYSDKIKTELDSFPLESSSHLMKRIMMKFLIVYITLEKFVLVFRIFPVFGNYIFDKI